MYLAACSAIIAAMVDFPDWRLQLSNTRGEALRRSYACQGSGVVKPNLSANITGSRAAAKSAASIGFTLQQRAGDGGAGFRVRLQGIH
jgi:hypothetical protein